MSRTALAGFAFVAAAAIAGRAALAAPQPCTLTYTSTIVYTMSAPLVCTVGVTGRYIIVVSGASGGASGGNAGGLGELVDGFYTLTAGQNLLIFAGMSGGPGLYPISTGFTYAGAGGGGASYVALLGSTISPRALAIPLLVAGAGGGATAGDHGRSARGPEGMNGVKGGKSGNYSSTGPGGAGGQNGNGGAAALANVGGAGGAGWYGSGQFSATAQGGSALILSTLGGAPLASPSQPSTGTGGRGGGGAGSPSDGLGGGGGGGGGSGDLAFSAGGGGGGDSYIDRALTDINFQPALPGPGTIYIYLGYYTLLKVRGTNPGTAQGEARQP